MEVLKRALLGAALLLCACVTRDPVTLDPEGGQLMVHAVLQAGGDTVAVLLTRVPSSGGDVPGVQPVSGASVQIAGAGQQVQLDEAPAGFSSCTGEAGLPVPPIGPGCYAAVLPGGVQAGARYTLAVQVPGGETVRGEAIVPAVPGIELPAAAARVGAPRDSGGQPVASIPVRWRGGGGAGFGVGLRVTALFAGGQPVPGFTCTFGQSVGGLLPAGTDTATVRVNLGGCEGPAGPVQHDSAHARLLVVSYDSAFTRYARLLADYPGKPIARERFAAGVTGALGLFGAVSSDVRLVTLAVVD